MSKNSLAALLKRRGRLAEAESLFRESLDICKAELGEQHVETLRSASQIASDFICSEALGGIY